MMHETKTLDAIILVRGSVDLLLDDGEARSLKPGDVVIQRSTNHAWVNTGNETALLVAVLVKSPAAQDGDEAP
ncbi:MAG: cupin domain-containing protein [Parvularculaceae bacterium]